MQVAVKRGNAALRPGSIGAVAEQHAAIGRHGGLAARGVVGQDRHHVAANGAELVVVIDPAAQRFSGIVSETDTRDSQPAILATRGV